MVNEQRPSLFQRATDYLNIFKAPPPRQVQPLEALLGVNKVLGFNDFLSRLPGLVSALDADRTEGRLRKGTTRPTNVVVILEKVAVELPKPSTTRKGKANCLQFLRVLSPDLKRNLTSKGYETESSSYGSRNQLCDVLVDQISIPTTASILLDDAQGSFDTMYCDEQSELGRNVYLASRGGTEKPVVFAEQLLLRPVFARTLSGGDNGGGKVQVQFRYAGAAFLSPTKMCEGDLEKM